MFYDDEYIEPFTAAVLSHSCNANTWIVFEGNELRVRSSMDIAAGTVLTAYFLKGYYDDIKKRKEILLRGFNIDCNCPLCQQGDLRPCSPTRGMLRNLDSNIPRRWESKRIRNLELTMREMKARGHGYKSPGMRLIYGDAMFYYFMINDLPRSLKSCLVLFYLIWPASITPAQPWGELTTLSNLIIILEAIIELASSDNHATAPGFMPQTLYNSLPQIVDYLRPKLVADTKQMFGDDSAIYKSEKAYFDQFLTRRQKQPEERNDRPKEDQDEEEVERIKNQLLEWAVIPARASEE